MLTSLILCWNISVILLCNDSQPAPNSYDEVYEAVFEYIDRIFLLIRPRKLLFMAIGEVWSSKDFVLR